MHEATTKKQLWTHGGDRWFDGFRGHKYALFDDFDGSQIEFRKLLRLLDKYPMQVPIKGGFTNWNPRKIFITSNVQPRMWYSGDERVGLGDIDAMIRRLDIVNHVDSFIFD